MTNFAQLFLESASGTILYNEKIITTSHKFPVSSGDLLIISIESTNHSLRQGVNIDISGICELDGALINLKKGKKRGANMFFWEDTAPKEIKLKIFPDRDHVFVLGARKWDETEGKIKTTGYGTHSEFGYYRSYCAAMWIEEIEGGWRYHCCNNLLDKKTNERSENFEELVFTVRKLV